MKEMGSWKPDSAYRHIPHEYFPIRQESIHHQSNAGSRSHLDLAGGSSLLSQSLLSDSSVLAAPITPSKPTRLPAIAYRPIRPSDLEVLQDIHEAFFPIKYEFEFFSSVVQGRGVISWGAIDTSRSNEQSDELIGFVTARVVTAEDSEEMDILGYELVNTQRSLVYILTLGVIKQYRSLGIASALVDKVIQYALSLPSCRAVYLHVISYNESAIYFYKKNSFQCLRRLRNFYYIGGRHYDSFLYAYFVNGGRSPCTAIDMLTAASEFLRNIFRSLISRLLRKGDAGRPSKRSKGSDVCGTV